MKIKGFNLFALLSLSIILLVFVVSCTRQKESILGELDGDTVETKNTYTNPLLEYGAEAWAIFNAEDKMYYYTQGEEDKVIVWRTRDITDLENAEKKQLWTPKDANNSFHLWGPEIHQIDGKWYIYFTADNGQLDNHQMYVVENENTDPFEGEFKMKGRIKTDKDANWAIHGSVFKHRGELYMIWSGWQTRRIEVETQCIYIAKMKTPWELSSDRILISKPEFEWERQWINPDGSRTAYPIYVNEAPQYFHTKSNDKVIVYYSASGNWTPYYAVGMLYADANADLLDASSWTKSERPVFKQSETTKVTTPGNISFLPSPDSSELYLLYHAKDLTANYLNESKKTPRLQKIDWGEDGFPILGIPVSSSSVLSKPSTKAVK